MANAPTQPNDPGLDPGTPAQGDMPGAYNQADRARPIQSPPSRVKGVAIAIGLAILALVILGIVTRDDDPNPPRDMGGDVPAQPAR
jgi:hypothetical protein